MNDCVNMLLMEFMRLVFACFAVRWTVGTAEIERDENFLRLGLRQIVFFSLGYARSTPLAFHALKVRVRLFPRLHAEFASCLVRLIPGRILRIVLLFLFLMQRTAACVLPFATPFNRGLMFVRMIIA